METLNLLMTILFYTYVVVITSIILRRVYKNRWNYFQAFLIKLTDIYLMHKVREDKKNRKVLTAYEQKGIHKEIR